jgi:hypothetical protein
MTEHAIQAHFISSPEKIPNSAICRQDTFDCFLGLTKSLHLVRTRVCVCVRACVRKIKFNQTATLTPKQMYVCCKLCSAIRFDKSLVRVPRDGNNAGICSS